MGDPDRSPADGAASSPASRFIDGLTDEAIEKLRRAELAAGSVMLPFQYTGPIDIPRLIGRAAADETPGTYASEIAKNILAQMQLFWAMLDPLHEVGLVSPQANILLMHVEKVWAIDPVLIVFDGRSTEDMPVTLIQHVSQVSVAFRAVALLDPTTQRRPVGFETDHLGKTHESQ